jgi:hypothetical protein
MTPTTVTTQRLKPVLERKEHILIPISNGPTPMRVRLMIQCHMTKITIMR